MIKTAHEMSKSILDWLGWEPSLYKIFDIEAYLKPDGILIAIRGWYPCSKVEQAMEHILPELTRRGWAWRLQGDSWTATNKDLGRTVVFKFSNIEKGGISNKIACGLCELALEIGNEGN